MGFTLIEVLAVFAISGIVISGITMTFYQLVIGSASTNNHMIAVSQVQNAGYWVSYDAPSAQSVNLGASSGFPLTLSWTDWDSTVKTVTYSLEGTELWRDSNGQQSLVARFIDPAPAETNVEFTDTNGDGADDTLILRVTIVVGGGLQQQSETREYRIVPRPGL
jgi:prepilin-type N-terminal cleavage/methylation domain-containing protein